MQPLYVGCPSPRRLHAAAPQGQIRSQRTVLEIFNLFKKIKNKNNNNSLNTYICEHTHTLYVATYTQKYFYFQRRTQRHKINDLVNKALHFLLGCLGTKISHGGFLLPEMAVLGMKCERGNDLWHLRARASAN